MESSFVINETGLDCCRHCGSPVAAATTDGLCSRCLLATALTTLLRTDSTVTELDSPENLVAGREFAGYELMSELGRGGMGVVLKARQRNPDRLVALKVIAMGGLASSRAVERFRLEARAAARLHHPAIAVIYEVGHERGWQFYSMQLIDGMTLAKAAPGLREDFRRQASLVSRVGRAVHYAHQRGILHRDLKPTNVILDQEGNPFLTDFGLAKMIEEDGSPVLTQAIAGTPSYMAPEQVSAGRKEISVATDVYGLGAILYELLCGRPPFVSENPAGIYRKIAEEEPERPAAVAGREVPPDLESICLKALEKEPRDRYASAEDMAGDLERWLGGEPIHARPCGRGERLVKWVRRYPARAGAAAAALAVAVFVVAGSLIFNFRLDRARREAQASALETRRQLVGFQLKEASRLIGEGDGFVGALSAVEALRNAGSAEQRQSALDRLELLFALSPRLARLWDAGFTPSGLFFSRDGTALQAGSDAGDGKSWELDSGRPAALENQTPPPRTNSVTSPDGKWIAAARGDYAVRVSRTTDSRQTAPLLRHSAAVNALAFSPDGRFLATGGADHLVKVWDMTGPAARLLPEGLPVCRPMFSPDGGRFIAVVRSNLFQIHDAGTGLPVGGTLDADGEFQKANWDRANRHFATCARNGRLRVWDATRYTLLFTANLSPYLSSCDFNPDGSQLTVTSSEGGLWRLRIPDGMELNHFEIGASTRRVEWSGDGRWFLTASFDGIRLWDGQTGKKLGEPLLMGKRAYTARFSPDSKLLVASFEEDPDEPAAARLWAVPSLSRVGDPLTHGDKVQDVRFSPDGRSVATSGRDGVICLWDVARSKPAVPRMRQDDSVNNAIYSPNGRWLVSCGDSGAVRFWESATGELLAPPLLLRSPVLDAAVSSHSGALLVRVADGSAFFFPLTVHERTEAEFLALANLCSGCRWEITGGISPVPASELVRDFDRFSQIHSAEFQWPAKPATGGGASLPSN